MLEPFASGARRERAARFHFPADALRCLAAEALLGHALHEAHGLDIGTLACRAGGNGKPRFQNLPAVHFNLTHSGRWVMCALHNRPIGIDVEEEKTGAALPAENIMCHEEYRYFQSLALPAAREFFYRLWTLKESFVKALGTGLRLDPRELRIHFEDPIITAGIGSRRLPRWPLRELAMPAGAKASLCCRSVNR